MFVAVAVIRGIVLLVSLCIACGLFLQGCHRRPYFPPSRPPRPPSSMMHVLCSTSSLLLRSATLIAGVQGALHCLHHPRASAAVAATCASTARAPSPASRPQSVPAGAAAIPVSISSSDSQYCLHHYPPRQQPRYQHRHDQHRRLRHRCHQCSCRRLCRRHSLLFIFC